MTAEFCYTHLVRELLEKYRFIYIFTCLIYLLTIGLTLKNFYPLHFDPTSFFISDLLGSPSLIPYSLIFISGFLNIFLILLISKQLFSGFTKFVPGLIYSFSFWTGYLVAPGSAYIFFLMLFLFFLYAFLRLEKQPSKLNVVLFVFSCALIFYSSLICGLSLLVGLTAFYFLKPVQFKQAKPLLLVITLLLLPVLILSLKNPESFKNSFTANFTIVSDIGIINYVNDLRGQPESRTDILINRITENKYVYITKYLVLKSLNNLGPANFFTPQEKLLGFSFIPPVLIGFIIPLFYGIKKLIKEHKWKYLILTLCLTIPSLFSKSSADLNRLILFFPVLIYLITLGLEDLFKTKQKIILTLVALLIFFQYMVITFDMGLRESQRASAILNSSSFSLGKQ